MDIQWFGQDCIRLESARGSLVINPYLSRDGVPVPGVDANVVSMTRRGARPPDGAVTNDAFLVSGPGEYEIGGIFIIGVSAPGPEDSEGTTTAYSIAADGLSVCHLGSLCGSPSQSAMERLGKIDVLIIPFGGEASLTPARAAELVSRLEPALLIPLDAGESPDSEFISRFLGEMGMDRPESETTLRVLPNRLPDDAEVRLLVPQSTN